MTKHAADLTFEELAKAGAAAAQRAADQAYAAGLTVSGTEYDDGPIIETDRSAFEQRPPLRKDAVGRRS
ncbi:hypothetical protein LPW26_20565 [Rhodopseudomonas sp. HC1]|uniref:hypothetical protein n=1 Tax=Rhodopseudomonas infernalis TaxID=2897386 RepID=UPI001EE804DB|nr:hypothetical protein [Rhodopseudomonas infernalis]MCG6207045.1 hypothetical protein [Rhodopseudomonas infernalis]